MVNNWSQYQFLSEKYIKILKDNPFVDELKEFFDKEKFNRILKGLSINNKKWTTEFYRDGIFDLDLITTLNIQFDNPTLLQMFADYINKFCLTKTDLYNFYEKCNNSELIISDMSNKFKEDIPRTKFSPAPLKFVTTTAVCWIIPKGTKVDINFKKLYEKYEAYSGVLQCEGDVIYKDKYTGKVVGCKTGGKEIKGFFKKTNLKDFYNCTTLNVVLSPIKSANVKVFNNGKLQLTGIPKPSDGIKVVKYVCDLINVLNEKDILNDENIDMVKLYDYKTVMVNTCYELGLCVNRETLYNIISRTYNLNAIYDSDGYPGVRIEYFYNDKYTGTENEGICNCQKICKGKGTGLEGSSCRKISIAIFQSGSAIIAGGCTNTEPIYCAYRFINNIISNIIDDIIKPDTKANILKKQRRETMYINTDKIVNKDIYNKIIAI